MKHCYSLILLSALAAVSCNKQAPAAQMERKAAPGGEIILSVGGEGLDMNVETKATEISAVPSSLYVERTTGTWKSETAKDVSASKSVSSGKINTGWYQTAEPTSYNYYLANAAITFAASGSTISATNTTDVIAGCTQAATASTTPSVTLDHVFARTATLTATAPSGYSFKSGTSPTWKIQSKTDGTGGTKGTYNIATKTWSGLTALAQTTFTSSSDLYLTPGVYTVTITYTLEKGEWYKEYTKYADVTLAAGKKNSLTTALPTPTDGAEEIVISVALTPWSTDKITIPTANWK